MAGPWEKYAEPQQASPWEKYAEPAEPEQKPYSGSILPFTRDAKGVVSFDPGAGILEPTARVGDMIAGRLDPLSQEGIEAGARLGAMGLPVTPGMRSGEGAAGALLPKKPQVPTAPELLAAGGAARQDALDMGVDYTGSSVAGLAQRLKSQLIEGTINSEAAPNVHKILDRRAGAPPDAIFQLSDVLTFRDALKDARLNFKKPRQKYAADQIIAELDQFVQQPPAGSVMAGPAGEERAASAANILAEGRANSAAGFRSQRLTGEAEQRSEGRPGVLAKAEGQAASAHSGGNIDNAIRQRVRDLLKDPKSRAGFSDKELQDLAAVRDGTASRNVIRRIGNIFGGGGGLAALIAAGAGGLAAPNLGWASLVGLPATGLAARGVANKLTKRALQAVDEAVRKRSPLAEALAKAAPQPVNAGKVPAGLLRALLATQPVRGIYPAPPEQPVVPLTAPYSPYRT